MSNFYLFEILLDLIVLLNLIFQEILLFNRYKIMLRLVAHFSSWFRRFIRKYKCTGFLSIVLVMLGFLYICYSLFLAPPTVNYSIEIGKIAVADMEDLKKQEGSSPERYGHITLVTGDKYVPGAIALYVSFLSTRKSMLIGCVFVSFWG